MRGGSSITRTNAVCGGTAQGTFRRDEAYRKADADVLLMSVQSRGSEPSILSRPLYSQVGLSNVSASC